MTTNQPRRAAVYARFSTERQNERSCEDQAQLCRQLAAREGLSVVAVYQDAAKSGGTIHGRSGLERLLDDAEADRFDMVIVEALDRLSRDMEDLAGIHKRLTFRGIQIRAVNEGVVDTVVVGLRGLVGQLFREDGAKKIRRGMSAVVRNGRNAGGRAYGYRPVPGKPGQLKIIEEEAAIIRRIFSEYRGGATPRAIAGRLNAEGVPPPRGKRWNASTINGNRERGNGLLLNPIYDGKIVWNRLRMVRDPSTGKRVSRANPESEWQTREVPALRIVEADLFEAVQRRKQAEGRPNNPRIHGNGRRILSGLLRCGSCGGGMSMHDVSAGRRRVVCSAVKESGTCDNTRRYYLDQIENAVTDALLEELDRPVFIERLVAGYVASHKKNITLARQNLSHLQSRRDKVIAAQRRLLDLVEQGLDIEELDKRLRELDSEARDLAHQIALAEGEEPPPVALDIKEVRRYVSDLKRVFEDLALGDAPACEEVRLLFARLLANVTVGPMEKADILPIKMTIRIGPLMEINGKSVFPDDEGTQTLIEELLGGNVVAEEGFEPPTQGL